MGQSNRGNDSLRVWENVSGLFFFCTVSHALRFCNFVNFLSVRGRIIQLA